MNRQYSFTSLLPASLSAALGALFLSYVFQGVSNVVGDIFGAFPIAKESAFPGLYPTSDLIVASGIKGPFHVYKAAGLLYQWGMNVDIVWFCLLLAFLFITLLTLWHLAFEITGSKAAASFTIIFLAVTSPWRGALHWTPVPIPFLVTSAFSLPIGFVAMTLFIKQRYLAALLVSALMFNIHPSGMILLVLIGSFILIKEDRVPITQKLLWLVIGAIAALPNAVYTISQLPGNFIASTNADPDYFYEQFRIFGYHAFIEDHWRDGYGWFLFNAAGAIFCMKYLDQRRRRLLTYTFTVLTIILFVYVLNLYLFKNRAIILLFLFRVTFFMKPLIFAILTYGLYRWFMENRSPSPLSAFFHYVIFAGFLYSLMTPNNLQSELVLLLTYSGILFLTVDRGFVIRLPIIMLAGIGIFELLVLSLARLGLVHITAQWTDLFLKAHIAAGIMLVFASAGHYLRGSSFVNSEHATDRPYDVSQGRLLVIIVLAIILLKTGRTLLVSVKAERSIDAHMARRVLFSRPADALSPLVAWIRNNTPRASLFIVPPLDRSDNVMYSQLRITTERGIYITLFDIYQLAYDVGIYREGIDRLKRLGVRVIGRHQFDDSAYHDLPSTTLKKLNIESGAAYAIFEIARIGPQIKELHYAYADSRFVVVDLNAL